MESGDVYRENKTGPRTDPWGTPYGRADGFERRPFTMTVWDRSDK